MAPSDVLNIRIAYLLGKSAHRHQVRSELDAEGKPVRYWEHPRRVAIYLLDRLEIRDPGMVIASLGHDLLEDTRVTAEMLEHLFGKEVVSDVKLLSKLPKEGYYERLIKFGNPRVWVVKLADRIDNLSHMANCSPAFISKQAKETVQKIFPVLQALNQVNEWRAIADKIAEDLGNAMLACSEIQNTSETKMVISYGDRGHNEI